MKPDDIRPTRQFHPSVYATAGRLLQAATVPRASGAMRYRCPVSASFVLVTEEPILASLKARPSLQRRCPACGEMHLLCVAEAPAGHA